MNITTYCTEPRTLQDLLEAGYTQHQVYNNVKAGKLVNITRRDACGRVRHNVAGLFQCAGTWSGTPGQAPAGPGKRFDAGALVNAWRDAA